MIKLINLWLFATTMTGTVDQIDGGKADVELLAKDGHTHEDRFALWMFPCNVVEGTKFSIKITAESTLIQCEE